MNRAGTVNLALWLAAAALLLAGCGNDTRQNATAEAPPPAQVEHEGDANIVEVDDPAQFPLATAADYKAASQLTVTGIVSPDVSRTVPVISIASGRVVEIRARLGDTVKKGQLLLRIQSSDIATAYADYRKAVADQLSPKPSTIAPRASTITARYPSTIFKSPKTPRTKPKLTSKPPRSISKFSAPLSIIPPASWISSRPFPA